MRFYFLIFGFFCILYYIILRIYTGRPWPTFSGFWLTAGGAHLAVGCAPFPAFIREFLTYAVPAAWVFVLAGTAVIVSPVADKRIFRRKTQEKTDVIIILGAHVNGTRISASLKSRLDTALDFLRRFPDTKVIVSGGQGRGEAVAEADAMAEYLIRSGIESGRIIREGKSASTRENLRFCREFLDAEEEKAGIVTSDFHVFRTLLLAGQEGYRRATAIPAPTEPVFLPNYLVREFFAVICTSLSGTFKNKLKNRKNFPLESREKSRDKK